jgi:predicted acyltransferase
MGGTVSAPSRIASLDQFRGYTVLGMFLVNFLGSFAVTPALLKHHNTYCSYADTIMPHFFFAVGFAYRLTFLRRLETVGAWAACRHAVKRSFGLILLGFVLYHLDGRAATWAALEQMTIGDFFKLFKRSIFQTLVHIGVTSLWVLPVIAARPMVRIGFAAFSGLLHTVLSWGLNFWPFYLDWSNYVWVNTEPRGIDGGPLGFLTWTIPLLVGSLAYDAVKPAERRYPVGRLLLGGAALMVLGYGLSCLNRLTTPNAGSWSDPRSWLAEPPFVPPPPDFTGFNPWTMSQRSGSVSYLVFGAGFSLALYALFLLVCDVWPIRRPRLAVRGTLLLPAWLLLLAGVVGVVAGGIGFVTSPGIDRTWMVAVSGFALLLGWDLRQLVRRAPTVLGSLFRTLGTNALAGYIIHGLVGAAIKPYAPRDAPLWYVLAALGLYLAICYLFIRHLEKHNLFLRL